MSVGISWSFLAYLLERLNVAQAADRVRRTAAGRVDSALSEAGWSSFATTVVARLSAATISVSVNGACMA